MSIENGSWRPDTPFVSDAGLQITMSKAVNLTPPGILDVPLRFQVPVTDDLTRPFRHNWATQDTLSAGQFSRKQGAQLLEIQINTILMDRLTAEGSSGLVVWNGAHDPESMVEELRFISGTDRERRGPAAPFRLVIAQPQVWNKPSVDMVASLTTLDVTQRSQEIASEGLSMTFLEYAEPEGQRARRGGGGVVSSGPGQNQPIKGSLYTMATVHLGRGSRWREIAKANGIKNAAPNSAVWLASWAKANHKTQLWVPAR